MAFYVCIFLIILCGFIHSTSATGSAAATTATAVDQIIVFEMPTRANYELPFTFKVVPITPIETDNIKIRLSLVPTVFRTKSYKQCMMAIRVTDGNEIKYPIDDFEPDFGYASTVQVNFNEQLSISTLLFTCALMNIEIEPDNAMVFDQISPVTMSITITDEDASIDKIEYDYSTEIAYQEALFQRYYWDKNHPGMISIDYTFYKPPGISKNNHYITHPFLDITTITSMHLSPSDNIQQDLGRLYNLIPSSPLSNLKCIDDDNHQNPLNFVLKGDNAIHLAITTPSPANSSAAYACTFTVRYPPDVIDYIFKHVNNPAIIITDELTPSRTITIPLTRPALIPRKLRSNNAIDTEGPLQIWTSPHHIGNIDHFEIGIAKSPYYIIQQDDPLDIFLPIMNISFQLNSNPYIPSLFNQLVDDIRCKSHDEIDYTDEPIPWEAFVLIIINGNGFDLFGKTCKINLSPGFISQTNAKYDHYTIPHLECKMEHRDFASIGTFVRMVKINAFYQSMTGVGVYSALQDTSMVSWAQLPPMTPIPLIKDVDTNGRTVLRGSMNVQFLLPFYPIDPNTQQEQEQPPTLSFQFVFPQCMNRNDIVPLLGPYNSQIRILFDDFIIYDQMPTVSYYGAHFESAQNNGGDTSISSVDPIATIFQPNRPFRSPYAEIRWVEPTDLDPVYPLTVTVEIPVNADIPTNPDGTVDVYPMIHLAPFLWDGQYHPEYALITPVRMAPLTGYSYRCVTWDKMAAPYVYASTEPAMTKTNSKPCSDYYTDGVPLEVTDPDIWKKSEYINHRGFTGSSTPSCLYELAAVCVTPSTTVSDAYIAHPLADCPSFLGETHAVPCSIVDDENGSWDYTINVDEPKFETINDHEPTAVIAWISKGDPRRTVSVIATAYSGENEDMNPADTITLATGAPSYLTATVLQSKRYQLPYYDPQQVKQIGIRVVYEQFPQSEGLHILNYNPIDGIMAGCTEEFGKIIDETIHLCVCQPGLAPSVPNGVDNRFIHPDDFTCGSACSSGFEWAHGECQCILNQDGCQHGGVCIENEDEDGHQCICIDGYYGDQCQYSGVDDLDPFCDALECVVEHTFATTTDEDGEEDENEEDPQHTCKIVVDPDDAATLIQCNCHPAYTGDRCELDNPDYIPPCDEGFEWSAKTRECEPDLPDDSVCHTFTETVLPPFFTNHCGYGVPSGANCDECSCLSRWVQDPTSTDKKCSRCKLQYGEPDEQCMKNGHTSDMTYSPSLCWVGRCLCNAGYYGPKCQHKVMYGTLQYLKTVFVPLSSLSTAATSSDLTDASDTTTILTRSQLQELELRVVGQISKVLHAQGGLDIENPAILHIQQATQTVTIINNDGEDNNGNNGEEETQEPTEQQQQIMTTIVIALRPHLNDNNNDNDNTDGNGDGNDNTDGNPFIQFYTVNENNDTTSLYDAWKQLQETGSTIIPEDTELGAVNDIEPVYDPHCVPNEFITCPDGKNNLLPPERQVDPDELEDIYVEDPDNPIIDISDDDDSSSNTTTYIIIGVVVGVVLILFILLIIAIIYCRKHNKMCFDTTKGKRSSKNQQGKSSQTNSVELTANSTSGGVSPSTGGVTSALSTSSHLPTQVDVDDPTLPADWIALEDKNTGKIYYSNKITMVSSWDHPAKVKDEDENEYGW